MIRIGLNQIEPEDVMLLAQELNLRGTAEATIGLLVDDSIVVLENVYRRQELGESKLLSARNGSRGNSP